MLNSAYLHWFSAFQLFRQDLEKIHMACTEPQRPQAHCQLATSQLYRLPLIGLIQQPELVLLSISSDRSPVRSPDGHQGELILKSCKSS